MKTTHYLTIAAAILATALGGCSREPDEPVPVEDRVEATPSPAPPPATTVAPNTPVPQPTPTLSLDTNDSIETPPEVASAPDEQVMDDASATGMTARASREEASDAATAENK